MQGNEVAKIAMASECAALLNYHAACPNLHSGRPSKQPAARLLLLYRG